MPGQKPHGRHIVFAAVSAFVTRPGSLTVHSDGKRITLFAWVHFGRARAHSHAAPPSSISMPVDNENDLEFTRMPNRRGEYGTSREANDRDSYGAQRLSATHAILLCPRSNGVAGRTHCLRSVAGHLYADRAHFIDPEHCDR